MSDLEHRVGAVSTLVKHSNIAKDVNTIIDVFSFEGKIIIMRG